MIDSSRGDKDPKQSVDSSASSSSVGSDFLGNLDDWGPIKVVPKGAPEDDNDKENEDKENEDDLQFSMDDVPKRSPPNSLASSVSSVMVITGSPEQIPRKIHISPNSIFLKPAPLSVAEREIIKYRDTRRANPNKYKRSLNFFCIEWGLFGYRADEKIAAAEFALQVLRGDESITEQDIKRYKGACSQGELGALCKEFRVLEQAKKLAEQNKQLKSR